MYYMVHFSKLVILCVAIFQFATTSYAENLQSLSEGQRYFNDGNYEKAVELWRVLADKGEPEAQVFIGLAYANGWGVKKNLEEASTWYLKAAENNSPSGQFLLGLHYVTNSGNPYDVRVGIKWLKRAADNGDNGAIKFLKKAKLRNWFDDIKNDSNIDKYELQKEGQSILDAISVSANKLPNLPAPTL